ncbi:GON-4-like protein, partial [Mustelus asterias]
VSAYLSKVSAYLSKVSAYLSKVSAYLSKVSAYFGKVSAYLSKVSAYFGKVSAYLGKVSAYFGKVSAYLGKVSAYLSKVSAYLSKVSAYLGKVSAYLSKVSAYLSKVSAYLSKVSAYFGKVSAYLGKVSAYLGGASGYLGGASGYLGGASGYLGGASGYLGGASGYLGGASGYLGGASGYLGARGSAGRAGEVRGLPADLYDFETNPDQRTAVDLYGDLCDIIQDWPQLLKDFAAFLLPEQALQCGLFEEQQAFDKSRKFLRQLEICFGENPSHYQKIIKALQSCMVCSPPDMAELKVQVWQLLKGHHHLQDEFSLFFDNLRPPSSRISDFEEVNWMEDKEYEFDGFEEVVLPDLEEEEELQKMTPPPRSKRRREGHTHEKSVDTKASKGKDSVAAGVPDAWITVAGAKEAVKGSDPVEGSPEEAQALGLNSKDSSSPGTRAPGSNTLRGCEETHPGRGPRLPGDSCCLEEGDENGVKVSERVNETPVSPLRSADETWSPASEGDGSESQGPEEGLADGSDPVPHSPCCPWREEPGRRRGGCPFDSTRPETGVGGKEEWTEPGNCCRDMAALSKGEDAAKEGGSPPRCRPAVREEGDTLIVHGAPNITREAASSKLELANAASGVRSDGPRGRGRHSTEQVAGSPAPPVETPAPLRGRDCGAALVGDTSPWEAGAQRDREPEERTTLAETGSAPREPPRNPAGHASVKFATAGAQVRFMSCQKLSDLLPVDLQLTLAHGHSRDAGSLDSADHEPPRGQVTVIPSPRLWETWEGAARDRLVTPSATAGSESPLRHTDSRASSTGEEQEDEQDRQAQAAVCAKNSRLSSTGERVVLWTREADRAILTACRESGANEDTFSEVAQQLNSKSVQEVSQRFRELMYLFHTSGDVSTDEEEDTVSVSNPEEQE